MKKTIVDVVCPNCNSENWYEYGTDEFSFELDGTGHYQFFIHCNDCGKDNRVRFNFEYQIIDKNEVNKCPEQ